MTPFPRLFAPISLGARQAKNRIMRLATTANLAERNRVGERLLEFYRTLAKGGVGTIVTEALRISPREAYGSGALVIHDEGAIDGARKLADVCHAEGALLIGQLNHGGRQHLASRVIAHMVAPSAIACPRSGGVPHELSTREVREMVKAYVSCAARCIEAGMDGVEIHGAQGHLIQQFVSPFSNQRVDEYGGSPENRLRFPREIIYGVRRRLGRSAIVGYRLCVEEFTPGGLDIEQALEIAKSLTADGHLDYLSLSQGNFNTIETHLPDRHWPTLAFLDVQGRFKPAVSGIPIIGSTRIQSPEQAERVLAAGQVDMIGMCRGFLVDPEWPNKARSGQADDIRRCIACNQCWGAIANDEPIACATNPVTGREYRFKELPPAAKRRHVVVIGGGPAGLEAARVAALRGHRVTLFEVEDELGGRLRKIHRIPNYEEMRNLLEFLVRQVAKAGVVVRTSVRATAESILSVEPDEIIIATGATPIAPGIAGDASVPVLTGDESVELSAREGRNIILMDEDGYYWAAAMAESLAASGRQLTIVTRFFEAFREIPVVSRIAVLREMDRRGAVLKPNMSVARISMRGAVLSHYLTGREEFVEDIAAVVWVGSAKPSGRLAEELCDLGVDRAKIHVIGDAFSPRRLSHALVEAHTAGRDVGLAASS